MLSKKYYSPYSNKSEAWTPNTTQRWITLTQFGVDCKEGKNQIGTQIDHILFAFQIFLIDQQA